MCAKTPHPFSKGFSRGEKPFFSQCPEHFLSNATMMFSGHATLLVLPQIVPGHDLLFLVPDFARAPLIFPAVLDFVSFRGVAKAQAESQS